MSKYYVALSQDGQEVAIFNSTKFELSTCTIDRLDKREQFANDSLQIPPNTNLFGDVAWSISISNKLANGEILIALSCFNKYHCLMSEDKNSAQYYRSVKRQSISSIFTDIMTETTADVNDDVGLEDGEMIGFNTTWIFSTLNKERIRTIFDDLGGIVRFLSPSDSKRQPLIIIHHYGIIKTSIPLNYRQHKKNALNKSLFYKFFADNPKGTIEFYFPLAISKQLKVRNEDRPQLNLFNKNIKNNYLFLQDCKTDKLNSLECYNLENGELIKSFLIDTGRNAKDNLNYYFRKSFNSVKNCMIIEISKNGKLLAYQSKFNQNHVTLYLMENTLEICTKEFTDIRDIIYIQFICNDEKLLIIGEQNVGGNQVVENSEEIEVVSIKKKRSLKTVPVMIIWDLFSSNSEEDSIKITHDSLNSLDIFRHHHNYASSNGNTIYIDEKGAVKSLLDHPDLVNVLNKKFINQSLKPLDVIVAQEMSEGLKKHAIFHLDNILDSGATENEAIVIYSEPWIHNKNYPRISVFLDEDKSIQLIIGVYSVQVWRRLLRGDRQLTRLEYIWISQKRKIEVKSLLVERNEFLLEFILIDENEEQQVNYISNGERIRLHWPHNVSILKDACVALECCHYFIDNPISPRKGLLFDKFRVQIQNIVKNFINYNPNIFRLTDIKYDIMGNLIRGNCVSIIKRILFINTDKYKSAINSRAMKAKMKGHLHFPRLYSWESNTPKKNDLEVAIETITGVHRKDTIIIGYLLDYYSDNAMENTGWMISVSQILPLLYDRHLDYYVKELFYKPCFGARLSRTDESLVSSIELMKGHHKNVHSMIIQQGLPRKPITNIPDFKKRIEVTKEYIETNLLSLSRHDPSVMTKLNVVPLPDFFTYPRISPNKNEKILNHYLAWRVLKNIILPHAYIEVGDLNYSPFYRILVRDNRITTFSNPSLAALVDYKWSKAQSYFIRSYAIYIVFALSFWTLTNVTRNDVFTPITSKGLYFPLQILLFYIGYLRLAFEYLQLKYKGFRKYFTVYNFFDIISIIMPLCLVISLNFLDLGVSDLTLRYYTVATSLTSLVMWIELLLLLRFFTGPANYINISVNIIRRVFYFFVFMLIFIVAIAHSMYILLRSPNSIGLDPDGQNYALFNTDTEENVAPNVTINQTFNVNQVSDNYFSNFWQSIIAVYFWTNGRWDQVDQWNFLPVTILCFLASILLITVMQNMLVALMASVFDEACALGNQAVLKFRADLISDYETLMRFVIDLKDENENPKELHYVAKIEDVERWESGIKKYCKLHKCILVDKSDRVSSDEEEEDYSDDESENEFYSKSRKMRYSESSRELRYSESSFSELYMEKLDSRMKEIHNDIRNKIKDLEDKLKTLLEPKR
ncbi:hypothetical protein RclHR1_02730009 [Rhizophagus clarus]|uniref:Ion transport domain-containing protein n=1 Tax=Rhizophagus clarus TaxID=94130 RepID=A0A2Z6R1R2_9GLOM|nr:hypothetical protein RclHR1_02730009 [Rhizophagus clarus]GES81136.1 hypothetical protein GLOIN_2v1867698 [Rhizophagus clarus]